MLRSLSLFLAWVLILLPCVVFSFLTGIQESRLDVRKSVNLLQSREYSKPLGGRSSNNFHFRSEHCRGYRFSGKYQLSSGKKLMNNNNRLYALPSQEAVNMFSALLANIDVSGVTPNEDATALVTSVGAPSAIFGNVIPGLSAGQAASLDTFLAEVLLGLGALGLGYYY